MDTSAQNRRNSTRRPVCGLRLYLDDDDHFLGHVVELSKTGLSIEGRIPIPVGRAFWFRIESPEEPVAGLPLYISGTGRHAERIGSDYFVSGVIFNETNGEMRTVLDRLVAHCLKA